METDHPNKGANWEDWQWHINNAIQDGEELGKHLKLSKAQRLAFKKEYGAKIFITPYMLELLKTEGENGPLPLHRQFLPCTEKKQSMCFSKDALHEEAICVTPHLLHKYKNRVALLTNSMCANYCQFCTRRRIVNYNLGKNITHDLTKALEYIKNNTLVNDVLLTGGDPLLLKTEYLAEILDILYSIKHVKIVRIGTRIPITLPMRIDDELISMLRKHSPLYINIHINHISEITEQSKHVILALANAGIPLGSQSVLLKGVNDDINTLKELFEKLLQIKIKPYYLFQCDEVEGCESFMVSPIKGIRLLNDLCGLVSGLAIPRYVIDTSESFSKLTLAPCFIKEINGKNLYINDGNGNTFSKDIPD
jgi:lysine 2,3-aminomutase